MVMTEVYVWFEHLTLHRSRWSSGTEEHTWSSCLPHHTLSRTTPSRHMQCGQNNYKLITTTINNATLVHIKMVEITKSIGFWGKCLLQGTRWAGRGVGVHACLLMWDGSDMHRLRTTRWQILQKITHLVPVPNGEGPQRVQGSSYSDEIHLQIGGRFEVKLTWELILVGVWGASDVGNKIIWAS